MSIRCPRCGSDHDSLTTWRRISLAFDVKPDGTPADMLTNPMHITGMLTKNSPPDGDEYRCDDCDTTFKVKTCPFCEGEGLQSFMYGQTDYYGQHGELDEYTCPTCGQVELCHVGDTESFEVTTQGDITRIVRPCANCEVEWLIEDLEDGICPDCRKNGGT